MSSLEGDPLALITKLSSGKNKFYIFKLDIGHKEYGILIADLIRHVSRAYRVSEDDVYEWVKKEMDKPTTPIESLQRPSLS